MGLGGRPVDLVGQDDVAEDRTRLEGKRALPGVENRHPQEVGWQEIVGELDPAEGGFDRSGQGHAQERFTDAGNILDQQVPAGQELSLIHISEPTRLLSSSYAVFCLKKKKTYHSILYH